MTRFLAHRILLAATGGATLVAACGGQVDSKDDTSAAGGSSGASAGSTSQGGSASGQAGSVTTGGSGGSVTTGGSGGSVTTGGSGGSVTTGGSGGSVTTGGSGGSKAGGAGSSTCAPGNCPLGETTCFSLASKAVCVAGPDGCGVWQESPCGADEKCTGTGQCVPKPPTTCIAGTACVGGEWCNADAPAQGGDACTCPVTDAPEKLACGQPYPWGMTVKVCYDAKGAECLPMGAPELYTTLENRFALSCATIMTGPTAESTSAGEARCCYDVSVFGCVGRPLVAAEGLRVAEIVHTAGWA